ncbi:MAG: hypothetical protein JKY08_09220 [Flavobacteriaceae bacterium]|nr:hypothetical protein [Flavobacteriaceae bacterium]
MYRYSDLVEEVITVIIEGYSSEEAIEKVMLGMKGSMAFVSMLPGDWTEIMNRAGSKASYIIRNRELQGTLERVPKRIVRKLSDTKKQKSYAMGDDIYGTKLTIKEKMKLEFMKVNALLKNESKALNRLIKKFDVNIASPNDTRTKAFYSLLSDLKDKK